MVLFRRSFVSGIILLLFALLFGPKINVRAVAEQSQF